MSEQEQLKAGQVVVITSGEYSDWSVKGLVRVLVDFDIAAEAAALPEPTYEPGTMYCEHCRKLDSEHATEERHGGFVTLCADGELFGEEWSTEARLVGHLLRKGLVAELGATWIHGDHGLLRFGKRK